MSLRTIGLYSLRKYRGTIGVLSSKKYKRPIILFLLICVIEFFTVSWYYTGEITLYIKRGTDEIQFTSYYDKGAVPRRVTPRELENINAVVKRFESIVASRDHPAFATWPSIDSTLTTCDEYNAILKAERILAINVFKVSNISPSDVSASCQTSLNRLDRVKRIMDYWEGPVSVAAHIRPNEIPTLYDNLLALARNVQRLDQVMLHLVLDLGITTNYPVNYLRNVAFNYSLTDRVVILDIDFITSPGLHDVLKKCELMDNDAVVIPAFEVIDMKDEKVKINGTEDLIKAWKAGIAEIFWGKKFPPGHRATNFTMWLTSPVRYKIDYELRFEPYLFLKKTATTPRFDERFMNRYRDKIQYAYALQVYGFNFSALPKVYVIHYPHPSLVDHFADVTECSKEIWAQFYTDLLHKKLEPLRLKDKKKSG